MLCICTYVIGSLALFLEIFIVRLWNLDVSWLDVASRPRVGVIFHNVFAHMVVTAIFIIDIVLIARWCFVVYLVPGDRRVRKCGRQVNTSMHRGI